MRDSFRGVWLEIRVIPVLLWSFSAITLGSALAAHGGEFHTAYYLGAVRWACSSRACWPTR